MPSDPPPDDADDLAARARKAKVDTMQRHVLVCTAADCSPDGTVARALSHGVALAGARDRVGVVETKCLSICRGDGATVVVYPEGTWYAGVDEALAERIVADHLVGGHRVDDAAFLTNPLTPE